MPLTSGGSLIRKKSLNIPGSSYSGRRVATMDSLRGIEGNDVVIAIMGPTGTGKSSFVNIAAGREEVDVGYDLMSKTRMVQPVRCSHPDGRRSIVLVDTPGFDDTHLSDVQVLKIIASWLKETYRNNIRLSGLLYMHRISDDRFSGSPLRYLKMLRDLCGETNLKNVVLVTTMWDDVVDEVGSEREKELFTIFWKDMIDRGSQTCRFQRTRESAWDIIERLCSERLPQGSPLAPLQIQEEMVDRGLQIQDTTAVKTLLRSLIGGAKRLWGRIRTETRQFAGTLNSRHQPFRVPDRPLTSMSTFSESSLRSNSVVISSQAEGSSLQGIGEELT